ncbi:MAG: MATE family Na+-driven efflux transporter [Acholeplasmataceae bacterium]|nr:hypothetical protein [Acholeplasmataceae bacterium]
MKKIVHSLKDVNYKLWLAILATFVIPSVYQTLRIYFLGNLPNDSGINIASQSQWLNLLYEIIQEAMILPLFFILGKYIKDKDDFGSKVRSGLIVVSFVYSLLAFIIIIFAKKIVILMAQDTTLVDATVSYIRLETIGSLFSVMFKFLMVVFITIKKDKNIYYLLLLQMILSMLSDTLLISDFDLSLKIGVNGLAITNIFVNIILIATSIFILRKEEVHILKFKKSKYNWLKEWLEIGKFSGMESFLRNLAFIVMIVRMVNIVAEQGNYWIANNFIWGWLLLPGLALADLVKQETAEKKENISTKTLGYIFLTAIFAIVWLSSIPLWTPFLKYVMNVENYQTVFKIALIQTPFYLLFMFNSCIFDATFYGRGKTDYMLYQSIIIDVFYYGIMFILYISNIFVPTLLSISLMFGIGMSLDFIPTMVLYVKMLKKEGITLIFISEKSFIKEA